MDVILILKIYCYRTGVGWTLKCYYGDTSSSENWKSPMKSIEMKAWGEVDGTGMVHVLSL